MFLDTIGCRLNQAEIERYAAKFHQMGHEIVAEVSQADLVVINTCSVTAAAASDSRGKIRRAHTNGSQIIVTGCWADLEKIAAAGFPGVSRVIPNHEKDRLVETVLGISNREPDIPIPIRVTAGGLRSRTRAFIKAQDGCDNFCAFCLTRLARGQSRSIPAEEIISDIIAAEAAAGKEIVLSGVNLGAWGKDLHEKNNLVGLIRMILKETDVPRVRLSSLEPWDLTHGFLSLWQDERMCPHLHLPIQSGSKTVLKRMVRRTKLDELRGLMEAARTLNPHFSFTTDLITGYPGETDAEFEETRQFMKESLFNGGHVFVFSERPGTAAARLEQKISKTIARERSEILRAILAEKTADFLNQQIDSKKLVLWENAKKIGSTAWQLSGYSENYLPVKMEVRKPVHNEIELVAITGIAGTALVGSLA